MLANIKNEKFKNFFIISHAQTKSAMRVALTLKYMPIFLGHFASFPHNFRNIRLLDKYYLEYVPWLMKIIFRHIPPRKIDNLTSKMKIKNLTFLEDFVFVGKNYHSENPQA